MRFYYPEFLFGLFLIAIPLIIHLFNFRKFKKVYFSNTAFLKDIQIQTSSWQKIKERLILLVRILAIAFLVLAFAKPYFPENKQLTQTQQKVVSIYLDNSYSMDAVNKEGSLLEEGKRKAQEIVNAFTVKDKFQLLTNDLSGRQNQLLNKEEFLRLLDSVNITSLPNNYQHVISSQNNFLKNQHGVLKKAFLISDFQQNSSSKSLVLDSSITYHLVKLKPNDLPNVAIDSAWFVSPLHTPNGQEKLVIKCENYSDKEIEKASITLKINGQLKGIGNISIKKQSSSTDTLQFSGLKAGWQKGEINIKDYPLVFDDHYNFAFEVSASLPITIINGENPTNSVAAAFATDEFFKVNNLSESQINYGQFANQDLIVLNGLQNISTGLAQQIQQYVGQGGNLSLFLPANADLSSYQTFLKAMAVDYPTALLSDTIKADKLNLSHPIFANMFERVPDNLDLPYANQYFKLSGLTKTSRSILISGEGLPLLNAYKVKKGNLYLAALPLSPQVSNFTNHGLFLPLLFKMAMLTNSYKEMAFVTGYQEGVLINETTAESEVLNIKGNGLNIIPELRYTPNGTVMFFDDQIKKAGFYDVDKQNTLLTVLAFNDSRQESTRQFYSNSDLETLFKLKSSQIINAGSATITKQIKEVSFGVSLWKLCLILALLCLAAEMLLIKYFRTNNYKAANN